MDATNIIDSVIFAIILVIVLLVTAAALICIAFIYKNWTFLSTSKDERNKGNTILWILAGFTITFAMLVLVLMAYYFANGLDLVEFITNLASET